MLQVVTRELKLVAVAVQFLTRVPVRLGRFDPDWLHASARHFPLVGALVGLTAGAALAAAAAWLPGPVAVLLSMAASLLVTGAFHEDGLADTFDGLGGAVTRERALQIMKDSRIGTYGAAALIMALALKAVLLVYLLQHAMHTALAALVLAHAASRLGCVALLAALPYAGDEEHAKAKPMAQRAGAATLAAAVCWVLLTTAGLAIAAWLPLPQALALLCAAATACLVCGAWYRVRLGGYTGDTLGAAQQAAELAGYFGLLAALGP